MTIKLYYCGGKGGTLHRVLKEGFQSKDMVAGDYGVGLYFTQSPVRAMQYSEVTNWEDTYYLLSVVSNVVLGGY